MAVFSVEKVMMIENIINFSDNVLDKFTNYKESNMKVKHKHDRK